MKINHTIFYRALFFIMIVMFGSSIESVAQDCPKCSTTVIEKLSINNPTLQKYLAEVRRTETNDNYGMIDNYGFLGAYLMGKPALIESGWVVDDGNLRNNSIYKWTPKAQQQKVNSKKDFLNTPKAQDMAMLDYTNQQLDFLKSRGVFKSLCVKVWNTDKQSSEVDIFGALKGAYLVGVIKTIEALKTNKTLVIIRENQTPVANYLLDGTSVTNFCIDKNYIKPAFDSNTGQIRVGW